MHVEDHPVEYGGFEGIIPKGEYGGGTVLLWDRGTWRPEGDPHKGYRAGNLKFALEGEKLRGSWALVRIQGGRDAREDGRAGSSSSTATSEARPGGAPSSVDRRAARERGHRAATLEEIAAASDRVWHSNRPAGLRAKRRARAARAARRARARRPTARPSPPWPPSSPARAARAPAEFVAPQLATLVDEAPAGDEWLHEMKFDGYRILARLDEGRVQLLSRNDNDWTERFPRVAEAVAGLPGAARRCSTARSRCCSPTGRTSFQALQNAGRGAGAGPARLLGVRPAAPRRLRPDRRARWRSARRRCARSSRPAAAADSVRYSDHVVGSGADVLRAGVPARPGGHRVQAPRRALPRRARRATG